MGVSSLLPTSSSPTGWRWPCQRSVGKLFLPLGSVRHGASESFLTSPCPSSCLRLLFPSSAILPSHNFCWIGTRCVPPLRHVVELHVPLKGGTCVGLDGNFGIFLQ